MTDDGWSLVGFEGMLCSSGASAGMIGSQHTDTANERARMIGRGAEERRTRKRRKKVENEKETRGNKDEN